MSIDRPAGDWNATKYDRVADPQTQWGAEVLERLPLKGDETVLDAGCGTGRVTELLLARLPRGRFEVLLNTPHPIEKVDLILLAGYIARFVRSSLASNEPGS